MNINFEGSSIGRGFSPEASTIEGAQKKIDTRDGHDASAAMSGNLSAVKSTEQRDAAAAQGEQKAKQRPIINLEPLGKGMVGARVSIDRESGVTVTQLQLPDSIHVLQVSGNKLDSKKFASMAGEFVTKRLDK